MSRKSQNPPSVTPATVEEGSEAVGKLLEYALSAYQLRVNDFATLDSKAVALSGYISIIMTLSTALLVYQGTTVSTVDNNTAEACFIRIVFGGSILLLAVAFFFCLRALRCRKHVTPAMISDVLKGYHARIESNNPTRDVMISMLKPLEVAEQDRVHTNGRKSVELQRATRLLFCSFAFAVLGLICQFAELMKTAWGAFGFRPIIEILNTAAEAFK